MSCSATPYLWGPSKFREQLLRTVTQGTFRQSFIEIGPVVQELIFIILLTTDSGDPKKLPLSTLCSGEPKRGIDLISKTRKSVKNFGNRKGLKISEKRERAKFQKRKRVKFCQTKKVYNFDKRERVTIRTR